MVHRIHLPRWIAWRQYGFRDPGDEDRPGRLHRRHDREERRSSGELQPPDLYTCGLRYPRLQHARIRRGQARSLDGRAAVDTALERHLALQRRANRPRAGKLPLLVRVRLDTRLPQHRRLGFHNLLLQRPGLRFGNLRHGTHVRGNGDPDRQCMHSNQRCRQLPSIGRSYPPLAPGGIGVARGCQSDERLVMRQLALGLLSGQCRCQQQLPG